ncbi:MAG: hypothetical protein PHF67_03600 [Candidatus Nanoarchaeia archaeon]|nr:hypothetical protein [Candidatus Nanoarchaeia archaeon]
MKREMKNKTFLIAFCFVLTILLLNSFVLADEQAQVDKAYECLKTKLGNNCGDIRNTDENAFTLLAMSYDSGIQSKCKSILDEKKNDDCWGIDKDSACNIKSTALAILALDNVGANVDDYTDWLLSNKKQTTALTWFLEIDSANSTRCEINGQEFNINENKQLSGSDPDGLSKAYDNYWFQINDITINYSITCDDDFVTALLYKRQDSSVLHLSSETHSASASDFTNEKVQSYCFATSDSCNYEGTLWAVLALAKAGKEFHPYIPYVYGMADETENKRYLPYAFLSLLYSSVPEYLSSLKAQQKQNKFWEESGNKLYDTSVALLSIPSDDNSKTNAKKYLLTLQDSTGCWSANTAFILFSAWQKTPTSTTSIIEDCEPSYYCVSAGDGCSLENKKDLFCLSGKICCSVKPEEQTCEEKKGMVCPEGTVCTESEIETLDTRYCCPMSGDCISPPGQSECEQASYECKTICSSDQEEKSLSCGALSGDVCCATKVSRGGGWTLIILLIILIILVILAILFRNQLKIWLFKLKSGFKSKKGPAPTTRPSVPPRFPPLAPPRQMMPRGMIPRRPPMRSASRSQKDSDFEATMKKLRDMTK